MGSEFRRQGGDRPIRARLTDSKMAAPILDTPTGATSQCVSFPDRDTYGTKESEPKDRQGVSEGWAAFLHTISQL